MKNPMDFVLPLLFSFLVLVANHFNPLAITDGAVDGPHISNPKALAFEIAGDRYLEKPPRWIHEWFFEEREPFKYRILGKVFIYPTYLLFTVCFSSKLTAFYASYVLWSFIFISIFLFICKRLTFEILSESVFEDFDKPIENGYQIFVYALSVLLPPVLLAFKFPIHGSPNDFLGYILIALALICLKHERINFFVAICLVSVFCRETNLIVLLPLLFFRKVPLGKRAGISLGILLFFAFYRLAWPGYYDPTAGARHNFKFPYESLAFLFLTFGPLWLIGMAGWYRAFKETGKDRFSRCLVDSFIPALTGTLLVTAFFARIREIRIEFVLFCYFIPFGTYLVMRNLRKIKAFMASIYSLIHVAACLLLCFMAYVFLMPANLPDYLVKMSLLWHFYSGFGGGWVSVSMIYLFLFLLCLPFVFMKPGGSVEGIEGTEG